jgi:hypothetical protein
MDSIVMLDVSSKLVLEKVYGMYVDGEIEGLVNSGENVFGLDKWKEFRLCVSGGDKTSMGSIGMGSIIGFINELELFDNMMCDWGGCYRGEFRWECRGGLFDLLDSEVEDVELRDSVKMEYNKYFGFEDK